MRDAAGIGMESGVVIVGDDDVGEEKGPDSCDPPCRKRGMHRDEGHFGPGAGSRDR